MSNVVHNQWLKFKFWTPLQKKIGLPVVGDSKETIGDGNDFIF